MAVAGTPPEGGPDMPDLEARAELVTRLHRRLRSHVTGVTDEELRRHVEDGVVAAEALAIRNPADVYRFLRLRYVPASCWARPGAQEVLVRVLTDTTVDAGRRLDFVERLARGPGVQDPR